MTMRAGYVALAGLFLLIAGAIAVLAQGSPEASYTPITAVVVVLGVLGLLFAGILLYLAVKG